MKKNSNFNVPNILSGFRIIAVFFVCVLIYNNFFIEALIIYVCATLTDLLDGFIARKFNMITPLGKVLDPLADKFMQVAVIVMFTLKGAMPRWIIIIVILKELLMLVGGIIIMRREQYIVNSNMTGKIASALMFFAIACTVLFATLGDKLYGDYMFFANSIAIIFYVALIPYMVSFLIYIRSFTRLIRASKVGVSFQKKDIEDIEDELLKK